MADCLFCKLVAGEIPAKIVKRTADAVAFHDIDPKAPCTSWSSRRGTVAAVRSATGREGQAMLGGCWHSRRKWRRSWVSMLVATAS